MDNEQVIIDVNIDGLIGSLQDLQRQYAANQEAIKNLDKESETYAADLIKLQQQNKALKSEMRGVEGQIQNSIKAERAQEDSIVQMRAKLANLNKQYDSMSGMERFSDAGKSLQREIDILSHKIGHLEEETGRYQRNVGNYKSALSGLKDGFKGAGIATGGLDQSLKLLSGNPIVLFFTAIVSVVKAVIKSFKDNEAATVAMKEALAPLNPVIDGIKRGMEAFANVLVKVVGGAIKGVTQAFGWLLEKAQAVGQFFGADWHMADNFRAAQAAAVDLQDSENKYLKAKREWSVEVAKIDREVADLREKAAQKDQYNAKERLAFLDKAIALETRKAEQEKAFAQWELENLQKEAERSANSAEVNERLAEAERAVIEADTRLSEVKRNLSRQRQSAIKEINGITDALAKQASAIRATTAEIRILLTYAEVLDKVEKSSQAMADRVKAVADSVGLFDGEFQKMADRDAVGEVFSSLDEPTIQDKMASLGESYLQYSDDIKAGNAALVSSLGSLAQMQQAIADDETKSTEERAEAAKKARGLLASQALATSGVAMAEGLSKSMAMPFPSNLIAAASTLATLLGMISQIKSIMGSFETGGVIGGYNGASMGGDNTYIHARNGEMVINANQQRRLFDIANGHTGGNQTAAIVEALRAMPAPILEYREFKSFTDKVVTLEDNVKLH